MSGKEKYSWQVVEGAVARSHPPEAYFETLDRPVTQERRRPTPGAMEETGVFTAPNFARPPTLSETLWGEDILAHLPIVTQGEMPVRMVRGDWDRAVSFLEQFPGLREEAGYNVISPAMSLAKQRFFRRCCDLIEFWSEERLIGLFIGNPEDWSTYYCRIIAFNQPGSGGAVMQEFARRCCFEPLTRLGVERMIGDTSPTNTKMARWFMELGFVPTAQGLTERWGPFVRFTKYLQQGTQKAFLQRFGPNQVACANDNHERRKQ